MQGETKLAIIRLVTAAMFAAGTLALIYFGFVYLPPNSHLKLPKDLQIDTGDKKLLPPPPATSTVTLLNPQLKHTIDGKVSWSLSAEKITADTGSGGGNMTGAQGDFYGKEGRILSFTAPKTVYDPENKSLRVDGVFKGTLEPGGQSVSAADLLWQQDKNELTATDADINLDDAHIKGKRLRIDTKKKTVSLEGGVEINIPVKD